MFRKYFKNFKMSKLSRNLKISFKKRLNIKSCDFIIMVRNTGGNKAKKFASKSFNISNRATRFSVEEGELYAVVQRMLGNNNCEVLCIDGTTKLCIIRGKFLGKGKRDNKLSRGVWVLVGIRDWQVTSKEKEKCDLLEVYNDNDKEKLIKNSKQSFRIFLSVTDDSSGIDHDQINFINDREEELYNSRDEVIEGLSKDDNHGKDEDDSDNSDESEKNEEKGCKNLAKQLNWINIDEI